MTDDPVVMTSNERRTELAAIFAAVILRQRYRLIAHQQESSATDTTCLELPSETVLSDHDG